MAQANQKRQTTGGAKPTPPANVFELKNGYTLELKPISRFVMTRFDTQYREKNPEPKTPHIEVNVGGKKVYYENPRDPDYVRRYNQWAILQDRAYVDFLIMSGVASEPPKGFKPDPSLDTELTPVKILWVESMLSDDEERNELASAIIGQTIPNEQSIGESEKN